MTISLGSIEVGRCYLVPTESGIQVWRVTEFLPNNRLGYEVRNGAAKPGEPWSR